MPKRRMAASSGLHESLASQPESSYRKVLGDLSKHVQFPDEATLQILYHDTLHLWVSLGRLVPLLYF